MVCRYFSFSSKNTHVIGPLKNLLIVNPLTPRSDSQFSPPATTYFLLNKLQEFGGRSRQQLLFVMFAGVFSLPVCWVTGHFAQKTFCTSFLAQVLDRSHGLVEVIT